MTENQNARQQDYIIYCRLSVDYFFLVFVRVVGEGKCSQKGLFDSFDITQSHLTDSGI